MIDIAYILCPGHSGSTVVGRLLGGHHDIATAGELKMVPLGFRERHTCSCGTLLPQCPMWIRVAEALRGRGFDLASEWFVAHLHERRSWCDRLIGMQVGPPGAEALRRVLTHVWPSAAKRLRGITEANEALVSELLGQSGRRLFLDTSKDAARLRILLESGRFSARVIHLVRDGRAVAYSLIRKNVDPVASAPQETLDEICRFLDLEPVDLAAAMANDDLHILGNRMRMSPLEGIKLDTAWQDRLTGEDLKTVTRITAPWNARFGYPEHVRGPKEAVGAA